MFETFTDAHDLKDLNRLINDDCPLEVLESPFWVKGVMKVTPKIYFADY